MLRSVWSVWFDTNQGAFVTANDSIILEIYNKVQHIILGYSIREVIHFTDF